MIRYRLLLSFFMLPVFLFAQHKYDYQWAFGYGEDFSLGFGISTIDFNDNLVMVETYEEFDDFIMGHSGSFICDEEGEVKLMTNNCEIVDKNFNVIEGGATITPGETYDIYCPGDYPSNQCTLFLPEMSNDSVTYLVHKDLVLSSQLQSVLSTQLYLSVIVERDDGSFYLRERITLIEDIQLVSSRLAGVLNASGDKWWVWGLSYDDNRFYKFLIGGEETVEGPFIQEIGPMVTSIDLDVGQAAFSPNGEYLAINSETYGVMLYDFDAENGALSNYQSIPFPDMARANGLVFSPNSRFIYVNGLEELYQIDLQAEAGDSTILYLGNLGMQDINGWPVATGMMYLGPDCRVYISPSSTSRVIHLIHQPNQKGVACEVEQAAIRTPTRVDIHLPNLPMYRFNGSCDSTIAWGIISDVEEPVEITTEAYLAPNPATTNSTLFLPSGHGCRHATLLNVNGQRIRQLAIQEGQQQLNIPVQGLIGGLYLIRLDDAENTTLKLLVK